MHGQRRQVVGQAGRGRWVVALQLADQRPQPGFGLGRSVGLVERRPVAGADAVVQRLLLGQLGQDIPQPVHRAALTVGTRPQLADGAHQAGCAVAHHQQRLGQPAGGEAATELEPVVEPLALPEAHVEQHPAAVEVEAPGHQHALARTVRPHRQVDGHP